ncbi:hypothetical protein FRB94_012380 [Tulasnella sp. JGI-2019a]|nr:hypothetical protein FRB93_008532 [Tulasnella sp. JGI-2019a]KAG8991592.1 hypothetical protein FRB94_012380 [Tulasnella sp. JGI-2019a]
MTLSANPDLGWGAMISNYAKRLDLKYLKVNAHLPPLDPHPPYRKFDLDLPPAILVRQVYPKIYEHAKKTFLKADFNAGQGLVVLGQPGIGKTAFLYYALVRALKDRIPVMWCLAAHTSDWLQFDGNGNVAPYTPSRSLRRLSFFDEIPPRYTSTIGPGYIVQAASLQRQKYQGWAKQFRARYWVMENWSADEVDLETQYRQIATSNGSEIEWRNAYTPQEAFAVIGPSARRCFDPRPKLTGNAVADFGLEDTIEKLFRTVLDVQLVIQLLTGGHPANDTYPPGFHDIFFVGHVEAEGLPAYHVHLLYEPVTSAQRRIVREKILKTHMEVEIATPSLFRSCPSVAGYAYEAFAQRAFSHGAEPIAISWHSVSQLVTRPRASSDFDPEIPSTIDVNTLYYPTIPNFPSLDCFFVTESGNAIMLQVTVSKRRTDEDDGIKKLLKYIRSNSSLPCTLNFSFVYVVPFHSSGGKLVSQFKSGERIVSGQMLRVGYTKLQLGNRADELLKKVIEKELNDTAINSDA